MVHTVGMFQAFYTLLMLLFFAKIHSQDSITFSPAVPLCVGERVEMICYIEPPDSDTFVFSVALVSFDGSIPATLAQINANDLIDGVDLTRYSANTEGLNLSTARPAIRLIIDSYLPYDSDTLFGCHGTFSDTSPSDAIVSGMPMGPADPITALEGVSTIRILPNCAIHVSFTATTISSNRLTGLTHTFTLRDGTTVLETVTVVSDSPTHNVTFSTNFTVDVCYSVTVSVKNCANQGDGATTTPTFFSLPGVRNTTGNLTPIFTGSSSITWEYTDTSCPDKGMISIPDDLFRFHLIMGNNIVHNITEFTVDLPDGFEFTIPPNYDLYTKNYSMRIRLCDQDLTDLDIPICVITELESPFIGVTMTVTYLNLIIVGPLCCIALIGVVILITLYCYCCNKSGKGYSMFGGEKRTYLLKIEEQRYSQVNKDKKTPKEKKPEEAVPEKPILYADIYHIAPKPPDLKRGYQ